MIYFIYIEARLRIDNSCLEAAELAGAAISALPMCVMYFSVQRHSMEGVTIGAVKG